MRRLTRVTSLVLVVLLLVTAAFSLVACNKNKKKGEPDHRAEYCDSLESAILSGLNSDWGKDMNDNQVAVLSSSGNYIVTSAWVKLICDTVEESSLQSAKIKVFADFIGSDEGKAMLSNFSDNSSSLLDLLYQVDFTAEDISSLIYGFVYKTVDKSEEMMDGIINRISDVKTNNFATPESISNLTIYLTNVNKSRTQFVPNAAEKSLMLEALKKAESGISDIVKFAYGISLDSITDNILSVITSEDGALSDVTDAEIKTILSAVASNAASLKSSLTKEETGNINEALNLIINKFDTTSSSSLVFAQIVTYSKYAYMIVDAVPEICDVLGAFARSIDDSIIGAFRTILTEVNNYDEKTSNLDLMIVNGSVGLSKLISKMSNELGKDGINNIVQSLYEKSDSHDYQKTTPIYIADMIANFDSVLKNLLAGSEDFVTKHPEIISKDMFIRIINITVSLRSSLNKFKAAYYEDVINGEKTFSKSSMLATRSFSDIVNNPYNVAYQPELWYSTYVNGVTSYLTEYSEKYLDDVKLDLEKFVEEYFESGSQIKSSTEKLATMNILPDNAPLATIEEYKQYAEKSGLYSYSTMLLVLLAM